MEPRGQDSEGFYNQGQEPQFAGSSFEPAPNSDPMPGVIEWEASEYIHHDKGPGWMAVFVTVALALIGAAIWIGQWTFAVLLVVMAVAFGYFALRRPRVVHYKLNATTLTIGSKSYSLGDFGSFGVMPEGAFFSARLIPLKRFSPAVIVYFAEDDGEKIVDILGSQLPMQDMQPDPIDMLMRKLRF